MEAAKIVLMALWPARMARPELLWALTTLAREVTRWTKACDKDSRGEGSCHEMSEVLPDANNECQIKRLRSVVTMEQDM